MHKILLGILAVVALLAIWGFSMYNKLVAADEKVQSSWAQVENVYQRRADLIPNLVATVKGYAAHEKTLLENVTAARSAAINANSINDKINAENLLSSALAGLKVSLEAYPDLKANQNFMQLQDEISDIENKLAASRRFFNSATKELNNAVQTFPSNVLAGMFGFKKEPMFEVPATQREALDKAPEINF